MPDWSSTFAPTLPLAELAARGSATYLALLVLLRILGHREAGGLGITDILLVVLVAEAAAPGLYGAAESVGDTLVIVTSILIWSVVIDAASYRWPVVGRVVKSKPEVLIEDGQPNRKTMKRELMSADELGSILRLRGIHDISEVEHARIEPNGMVSIVRRDRPEVEPPERSPVLE